VEYESLFHFAFGMQRVIASPRNGVRPGRYGGLILHFMWSWEVAGYVTELSTFLVAMSMTFGHQQPAEGIVCGHRLVSHCKHGLWEWRCGFNGVRLRHRLDS
jgi:hypothetical protein